MEKWEKGRREGIKWKKEEEEGRKLEERIKGQEVKRKRERKGK